MIGILLRLDYTPTKKEAFILYKSIIDLLNYYDFKLVPIIPTRLDNITHLIDMCDGIILQGGSNESVYDDEIIRYIYNHNIPCLGICMGMQQMGKVFNGCLKEVNNHMCEHYIKIKNSNIYEDGIYRVNSRHHEALVDTDLEVTGYSDVIEMIEDKSKTFFVGVQWHPEDLKTDVGKTLIDSFINSILKHQKNE